MGKLPHIMIIGAGLIGLSTADSLAARGARVSVIDCRGGPGQGASFRNSGMIHPSQARPWFDGEFEDETRAVVDLAQTSKLLLGARLQSLGLKCAERSSGCIQLFDNLSFGQQAKKQYLSLGIACEIVKDKAHTYGRYALHFPGDTSGNAYDYCRALETDIKQRRVDFIYRQKDIPQVGHQADHVVIAAGTGSPAIASEYGVDLPVVPMRGHALNFKRPDMVLPDMPIMHHASRSALTVFDDHVRLSGTMGEGDPGALLEIWAKIAPELMSALGLPVSSWSEDRPVSSLGRPIITQLKPGLWVNTGHAHMGWTLSAGSGALMAKMILDGHVDARFALGV